MTQPIKLIVSDLDGTLLNHEHLVSDYSKRVFQALAAAGKQIIVATGRHYQDVHRIAKQLEVESCLITSNGARLHNHQGQVLYENHIPADLADAVLQISSQFPVHRNLYQGEAWLVEEENKPLLHIHHSSGFGYTLCDLSNISCEGIDKFYFNAEHDLLVPLEAALREAFNDQLAITFTSDIYLEVMNKGVSKGAILEHVLQQRGLQPDEVMAFGDGFNDVDMLNLAGHGVVMANANPKMKSIVNVFAEAKSNSEDGVADYLNQYFFQGKL